MLRTSNFRSSDNNGPTHPSKLDTIRHSRNTLNHTCSLLLTSIGVRQINNWILPQHTQADSVQLYDLEYKALNLHWVSPCPAHSRDNTVKTCYCKSIGVNGQIWARYFSLAMIVSENDTWKLRTCEVICWENCEKNPLPTGRNRTYTSHSHDGRATTRLP